MLIGKDNGRLEHIECLLRLNDTISISGIHTDACDILEVLVHAEKVGKLLTKQLGNLVAIVNVIIIEIGRVKAKLGDELSHVCLWALVDGQCGLYIDDSLFLTDFKFFSFCDK
jgi:hypothetical protein